jgi:uncharacterized protein with von Willebrand factor type A (vWA) domain
MKKLIFVIFALFVICSASASRAEEKKFAASVEQTQRLKIKQLEVQVAFNAYQGAIRALADEAEGVKRENNWPADLMFSMQTLEFNPPPPKAPAPMPEKKP